MAEIIIIAMFDAIPLALSWTRWLTTESEPHLRPTHFGLDERRSKASGNPISHTAAFEGLLSESHSGFFLFGAGFKIHVDLRPYSKAAVVSWHFSSTNSPLVSSAASILLSHASEGAVFAFACDWAEYEARNRYTIRFLDGGTMRGFIGMDYHRYVPGLYWLTYFATGYAEHMGINSADICGRLNGEMSISTTGFVIKLYEQPGVWRANAGPVDDYLHQSDHFFSMRRVAIPTDVRVRDALSPRCRLDSQWP